MLLRYREAPAPGKVRPVDCNKPDGWKLSSKKTMEGLSEGTWMHH
jgi:hypothetical protein